MFYGQPVTHSLFGSLSEEMVRKSEAICKTEKVNSNLFNTITLKLAV